MRISFLIVSLSLLVGCAIGLKPQGTPLRPESAGKILLRVMPDHLDEAQTSAMAERISKNLSSLGYPVEPDRDKDGETGATHRMEARVGRIENRSTPTGFSFTIGDSDPRALNFQKADVLPVTCTLKSIARSSETADLSMDFVADEKIKNSGRAKTDPALLEIYENHIGTVCFNLLDKLKVPRKKTDPSAGTTPWMPEIRIEVMEKPASPSPTPLPGGGELHSPMETGGHSNPDLDNGPSNPPQDAPIKTETDLDMEEGRKRIIIHNRGNPVILDFGFERK